MNFRFDLTDLLANRNGPLPTDRPHNVKLLGTYDQPLPGGGHLNQLETAFVLQKSGLSPLGPLAVNTMAPDEGNMYLLGKVGSPELKERFLKPLVEGRARSAFFMTEPAMEGGAGSDPSMMKTTCRLDGNRWVINGRKLWISRAEKADWTIVMAVTVVLLSLAGVVVAVLSSTH